MLEALRVLGADAQTLAEARRGMQRAEDDDVEVFEDCVESVRVFQLMQTQWRRAGMEGSATGLDYGALPVVMRYAGVAPRNRSQVFADVRVMEIATLDVYSEKAK